MKAWPTARREISLSKTLVMAILNVTPDSFSDGGRFFSIEDALRQAEKLISEGADILDVGGESTRPKSERISVAEETNRVVPIIEALAARFDVPISVDTSKAEVAEAAVKAGAEIVNDVSGLRFDEKIAGVAAEYKTGLILTHLRGTFETMHQQKFVADILREVREGFERSIATAKKFGVNERQIVLDVGLGFSKSFEQNLELIGKLENVIREFPEFPFLIGASRKSFVGKILNGASTDERLSGTLAASAIAVWNGAHIVRVHDVKETVEALKVVDFIKKQL
jgi:dihydropteroate synthase